FLVKWIGWRAAFIVPGLVSIACGVLFVIACPKETDTPSKGKGGKAKGSLSPAMLVRAFAVMTPAAATGSLLFNFTTNGNTQLLTEGFRGVVEDPAVLGTLLALIYAIASLAQLVVGGLIDRMAFKPLQVWMSLIQVPVLIFAAHTQDWWLFASLLAV